MEWVGIWQFDMSKCWCFPKGIAICFFKTNLEVTHVVNIWNPEFEIFDAIIWFGINIFVCEAMMHNMRKVNKTKLYSH